MDEGRITLDAKAFKALASDTRLDLMKRLDRRPMTVSELSREMELNKATLLEHLEKLADAEIAERLEDGRKWVYYQLTWRGKRILHPERITIALMLSTGIATLATGALSLWLYFSREVGDLRGDQKGQESPTAGPESAEDSAGAAAMDRGPIEGDPAGASTAAAPPDETLLYFGIALLLVFVAALVIGYLQLRKARTREMA